MTPIASKIQCKTAQEKVSNAKNIQQKFLSIRGRIEFHLKYLDIFELDSRFQHILVSGKFSRRYH